MDERNHRRAVEMLRARVNDLEREQAALESALASKARESRSPSAPALGHKPPPHHRRGVVLLYHRIATLESDPFGLCVSPDSFRCQMEYVARYCEPVSLAALAAAAASGRIPDRAVAITIDDGYVDALAASDILLDLHLPATFFVNSNAGGESFHDSLARVFIGNHELPPALTVSVLGKALELECRSHVARRATFETMEELGWALSSDGRRELVTALRHWSGMDLEPRPTHRLLMPSEVREVSQRRQMSIGAHSRDHLFLPAQSRKTKFEQIESNQQYLEALTDRPVEFFAYPYGFFDDETVEICREMGFVGAVTVGGKAVRAWDDPCLLPRVEVKAGSFADFQVVLDGLLV